MNQLEVFGGTSPVEKKSEKEPEETRQSDLTIYERIDMERTEFHSVRIYDAIRASKAKKLKHIRLDDYYVTVSEALWSTILQERIITHAYARTDIPFVFKAEAMRKFGLNSVGVIVHGTSGLTFNCVAIKCGGKVKFRLVDYQLLTEGQGLKLDSGVVIL